MPGADLVGVNGAVVAAGFWTEPIADEFSVDWQSK